MKISLTGANGHQIGRMQGIWRHFLILKNFLDYWQLRFNYCLKVLISWGSRILFLLNYISGKCKKTSCNVMKRVNFVAKDGQKQVVFCFKKRQKLVVANANRILIDIIAFKIRSISS